MQEADKIYAGDNEFWDKYIKGRPKLPGSCFERICKYHAENGGEFNVVHDMGAGVGVQSPHLAKHFKHVIVSDIVAGNVEKAQQRLGTENYSYRAAKIEDASDMDEASVDMVFAAYAMHHTQYDEAFKAIARQLRPGGTFAAVVSTPDVFDDQRLTDLWLSLWEEGLRVVVRNARDRKARLLTMVHAAGKRDTMPLDEKYFRPGALRIAVNAAVEGVWPPAYLPRDMQEEADREFGEVDAVGPNDQVVFERDPGWKFDADLQSLRDEFDALPFTSLEPDTFASTLVQLEEILGDGRMTRGVWPAKIILATRI